MAKARLSDKPVHALPPGSETALLYAAVQACPVNITISDMSQPDHPLIYVNPAFTRTTGYTSEDVIGRNCRFLQGPDTDNAKIQALRDAISVRRSIEIELVNYHRDGTQFLNRVQLAPIINAGAGIDAYIGIQHDVTGARAAEATRREREKLEALGRLAGGLAHELNNLLQPIVSYADLMGCRLQPDDAETAEQLAVILDSARAASDITRRVLNFSRRSTADAAPAPAGERISDGVRFAQRLLPPGVTLTVEGLSDLDVSWAVDSTELIQVLGNLFKNAADAMEGRGTLTIRAAKLDGRVVLTVSDDGPGMDPAIAARAFEPFFTTKPVGVGTGLGLSAVWGLIQGWGAQISLKTAPGHGACFTIEVPVSAGIKSGHTDGRDETWPPFS